ncbi:hypothetical protein BVY03_02335 [bacterium K02(2017)]|nr:hypothetical protein BVY03_02335 [bacterium K02(2017)]
MSLRFFHLFFISLSIMICLGFGWWCVEVSYPLNHQISYIVLGIISLVSGVLLMIYGNSFIRKFKQAKTLLIMMAATGISSIYSTWAQACPTCMRNISGKEAEAINWGIITLLICIIAVLACFAGFFIYLIKKNNKE